MLWRTEAVCRPTLTAGQKGPRAEKSDPRKTSRLQGETECFLPRKLSRTDTAPRLAYTGILSHGL
jgi:hypothetical protein